MKIFILILGAILIGSISAEFDINMLENINDFLIVSGMNLIWTLLWYYGINKSKRIF